MSTRSNAPELDVRSVGTGTRPHLLKAAGAKHILEMLEEALFLSTVRPATVAGRQSNRRRSA